MRDVLSLFRIWFLLGLPVGLVCEWLSLEQTRLGSVWMLAVGLPLLGMAILEPVWLFRWLVFPARILVRQVGGVLQGIHSR